MEFIIGSNMGSCKNITTTQFEVHNFVRTCPRFVKVLVQIIEVIEVAAVAFIWYAHTASLVE